ncbi:hypothetical protein LCGC14_2318370, partial [marine sediment metagenome]
MSIPTIEQLMAASITELGDYELLEIGPYLGVITNTEVRQGPKGAYLNVETTLHKPAESDDETCKGRKAWRNVSFSEKALTMPGGLAQLVQATSPAIPENTKVEDLPETLATVIMGETIGVELDHEQGWKNGGPHVDEHGNPVMRNCVVSFFAADDSFAKSI